MGFLSCLLADEAEQAVGFIQNAWNAIAAWFIERGGWQYLVKVALTAVIGLLIVKLVLALTNKIIGKSKLKGQKLAGHFIYNIAKVALLVIYFIAVLTVLGVDTSSLVAVLAASSLAVSLAMQSIMTNFASGMIIVGSRPFEEGDYISVGDYAGTVTNITLHSTTLVTPDKKVVIVPNSEISGGVVVNYSTMPTRRLDLEFSVAYGADVEKVKEVLTSVLDAHPLVLHGEGYTVRLKERKSRSLIFVCRSFVNNSEYWDAYFDLQEKALKALTDAGVEISYNKLDVNIAK